jgi:hypothetical protein
MKKIIPFLKKIISIYVAISLLFSSIFPLKLYATGPTAPEFSNFEPVSTTNMVSEYNGGFTYNLPILQIPGANGGGYALSLSYKGGSSVEDDASWVGYGWTINPGAIVRSKNGFPDDVKAEVTQFNDVPRNWTASLEASVGLSIEAFSYEVPIDLSETVTLQYNNRQGFAYMAYPTVGLSTKNGLMSLSLSFSDGDVSFSPQINPMALLSEPKKGEKETKEKLKDKVIVRPQFNLQQQMQRVVNTVAGGLSKYASSSTYTSYFGDNTSRNTNIPELEKAESFKLNVSVQPEIVGIPITALAVDGILSYNYQDAIAEKSYPFYGFCYSSEANDDDDALMDYYTEKDGTFNKRDYYLSVPWSRADQFMLMGEGLGGGFRAFPRDAGHFKTNAIESATDMYQLGIDIMAGVDFGAGASFTMGDHSLSAGAWDDKGFEYSSNGDEPFYFSFTMDPAQYMTFDGDETDLEAKSFGLSGSGVIGFMSYSLTTPSNFSGDVNDVDDVATNRIPRSSEIIYHTNEQMNSDKDSYSSVHYNRYSRPSESFESYVSSYRSTYPEQIGEFVVFNNLGNQYTYGLPVYAKNESNLSYDIPEDKQSLDQIVYENTSTYESKVGDYTETPYATSWLLTKITTPNYIDRTMDGPTSDDFGGYTIFNYSRAYGGSSGTWYQWRVPYTGLFNNPGSVSDKTDDMGSSSCGEKEVYYVNSIETNTHIAYFYTSDREDGFSAADDNTAANSSTAQGSDPLQKLDSICLYAKDASGAAADLIKRTYFSYDYSLMDGQLNSWNGSGTKGDAANRTGKLTLKKVWFEYEGVYNAKISPYEFEYTYPADGTYPSKYSELDGYGALRTENPDYDALSSDAWGSYQYDYAGGEERLNNMIPWLNQAPDETNFDPAAWQLKVIKLPTGGEIHVQYEQADYRYVQDRRAMAMVSIDQITNAIPAAAEGEFGDKYYLNLAELDLTSEDYDEVVDLLEKQFIDGEDGNDPQKIYFKFFYSLIYGTADLTGGCGGDYITGYVDVCDVGSDATGVYLKLGDCSITDAVGDEIMEEEYRVPRQICIDFYNATRTGNINSKDMECYLSRISQSGSAIESLSEEGTSSSSESAAESVMYSLLGIVGSLNDLLVEDLSEICLDVDEANSYFKIPVLYNKKGGGIRVKRILTFDEGLESNDAVLYGKEFVYQNTDGLSSGVASNEPRSIREENPLVTYLDKRKDSDWLQRIISGKDQEQFEGPMGEGILPGPSVGYARVVIKNIHDDKNTNDGFEVKNFYSTKDFPFDGSWQYEHDGETVTVNAFDATEIDQETDWLPLFTGIYNRIVSNVWSSQGYMAIINDMAGKPKSNAIYSGSYDDINNLNDVTLKSSVDYEYTKPGEPVKLVNRWEWKDEADIVPTYRIAGKQMEIVTESREIKDHLNDFRLELDVSVGYWGIFVIPWVTGMVYVTEIKNELYTHVTNKTLFLPTHLKSIKKFQDGIYVNTQYDFYDMLTAQPMINVTNDGYNNLVLGSSSTEHDGRYVNFNFPASHYYDGMAYKSFSEGYEVNEPEKYYKYINGSEYYLEYTGSASCALEVFTPGDLLALKNQIGGIEVYNVGEISGKTVELLPTGDFGYNATSSGDQMQQITIVRSARSNQLSANVGSLTTYGGYPDVTNIEIDPDVLAARQAVADDLNAAAAASSGSISISLNYPDVYIMDGDTCVPMSKTLNMSGSKETYTYTYYDTVINCTPWNCTFPASSGTKTTSSGGSTSSTGNTGGGDAGYTTIAGDNTKTTSGTLMNNSTFTAGGNNTSGSTISQNCLWALQNPPSNDKYQFDFKTCSWLCWDCDTNVVKQTGSTDNPKITITIDNCVIEFTKVSEYEFYISDEDGELYYGGESNPCDAVLVDCIDFCPNVFPQIALDGVVASSATCLTDEWDLTSDLQNIFDIPSTDLNAYEYAAKGKWKAIYNYDYNTTLSNITATDGRTYNSGIYDDFIVYNWDYEDANDSVWNKLVGINKSSPHGSPLEEINALGIYSTSKIGYHNSVPYLVAANSDYENAHFESFENDYANGTTTAFVGEDGFAIPIANGYLSADTAHSGDQSFKLSFTSSTSSSGGGGMSMMITTYESELDLQPIQLTGQIIDEGYIVKIWLKSDKTLTDLSLNYQKYQSGMVDASVEFEKVAQTGEWTLYQAQITDIGELAATLVSEVNASIYCKLSGPSGMVSKPTVYIDDICARPLDAKVNAFVYDPTKLLILTSFDDSHFGLYYQYNDEGKLIRKLKETSKGMKTITETQYNAGVKNSRP